MAVGGGLYQFGPFRLDPEAGILYHRAEPTMLGRRAVALLRQLLESTGAPVSKDALVKAGWGGMAVADNNLTVQIAALRRVLAEAADAGSWIETLPRRGYRYVGPAVATSVPDVPATARTASTPTLPEKPSVAVLPFSNLSGDPEQEYFVDGMVDDIITGLARINWLFTIARNSTFTYKGRAVDARQVGREPGHDPKSLTPVSLPPGPHPEVPFAIAKGLEGCSRPRSRPCLRPLDRPSRPLRGTSGRGRWLLDVPLTIEDSRPGRELGVRYVLEGSVRKAGGAVRVTGQMIDAATGAHVWAERYDRNSEDIFALQDEIALSAVGAIAPSVRKAEIERVKRKRPDSLDAYDLVLRAQTDVDSGMPEQVMRALILLERAIELDPGYALAYGNAAMCQHCLFLRAGLREADRAASIRYARSAILHGQDDAAALTLAGFSIGMDGHDRGAAFTALEAALAISPSSALTYILGSVILGWGGDAERAIEWSERGIRLSPFDAWAFAAFDAQAMSHLLRGRYEESCRAAYKSVQANSAHSITYMQLAAALAKLGRLDEARAAAARVLELQPAFRYSRHFAGVNCAPALMEALGGALRDVGLPE